MEEKEIRHILIGILSAAVNEAECDPVLISKLTSDNLDAVYRLAKKHDLAHVVSRFLYGNRIGIDDEALRKRLQQEELVSVYRHEQRKYAFEQICGSFEEANIPYVPLKGSVIRPYYPYESMRTSCDIDILIHEEDLERATACLESRGYCRGERRYHDVSLFSPNKIHLELHFNIQENVKSLDVVLKDAWKHTVLTKGFRYDFTKEFFVFHMYAHMAYHFLAGGCGIRSLLDIWVMEHKMGASCSCARNLLERAGIYKFASEMSRISNLCFTENTQDGFSELVLKYIFSGGVLGTQENNIAVEKTGINNSFVYALKRMFLPYKSMVIAYPVLKKAPFLLPFCWIHRWCKAVFDGKSGKIVSEMSCANSIPESKIREIREIRSRLKL